MKNYAKVLVFSPISEVKDYCMPQWLEHITNLTYPNYYIFLVDNSEDRNYFKKYEKSYPEIDYSWFNPKGLRVQDFIASSQEKCRQYAINGNFDVMMSIECDIFPPFDCIERLLRHDADVISGLYNWGFGDERKPLIQTSEHFDTYFANRNMSFDEAYCFIDGTPKEIFHAGIGCAAIREKVFKKIPFRSEPNSEIFSDTLFALDCYLNNFKVILDTSVVCEHQNQSWKYQEEITKYKSNVIRK
jgi:hypothetical protein